MPIVLDLAGMTEAESAEVAAAWRDAAPSGDRVPDAVVLGDRVPDAAFLGDRVPERSPGVSRSSHPDLPDPRRILVREPGDPADTAHLLERLSQRVTLEAITARRGELWMLHAAGLVLPDGRVIVLVGPSGRGKTTASRALGAHLGYASDETVAIDHTGRIFAYRKPLSIIENGVYPKVQRAPSDVGLGDPPDAPLQLAAIVLLDRQPDGPDEPVVSALDLGEALDELVSQSSYLPDLPSPLQYIAALIAPLGGARRVVYREASTLIDAVDEIVAPPAGPAVWRAVDVGNPTGAGYRRLAVADAVELDDPDRIAVLQIDADGEGMVRLLAGVAPALWRAADGVPMEALVAAAVEAYGRPEGVDVDAVVEAAVNDLIAVGLLAEEPAEALWRIRNDVAWQDSGARVVVLTLSVPDASPHVLEGSAAEIWHALDAHEARSTAEVAQRVADAVGAKPAEVESDVAVFLQSLAAGELVAEV